MGLESVIKPKVSRYGPGDMEYNFKTEKYIKNSNETSLLTWDQNKTLDTADNTNM